MMPPYGSRVELIEYFYDGQRNYYKGMIGIVESSELENNGTIKIRFTKRKSNELFHRNTWRGDRSLYQIPLNILVELDPNWKVELSL